MGKKYELFLESERRYIVENPRFQGNILQADIISKYDVVTKTYIDDVKKELITNQVYILEEYFKPDSENNSMMLS